MPLQQMPSPIFNKVEIPMTSTGFVRVDVPSLLKKVGYSGMEVQRLFKSNAIKILDTRLTPDGKSMEWYKRVSDKVELLEDKDIFYCGKRVVSIHAKPVSTVKKLWWWLRDGIEHYLLKNTDLLGMENQILKIK